MQLRVVDLPAPFGPIRAWIEPWATAMSSPPTAVSPPKRMVSPSTFRKGAALSAAMARLPDAVADKGEEAARRIHHEQDQDRAVDDLLILRRLAQHLRNQPEDDRP